MLNIDFFKDERKKKLIKILTKDFILKLFFINPEIELDLF